LSSPVIRYSFTSIRLSCGILTRNYRGSFRSSGSSKQKRGRVMDFKSQRRHHAKPQHDVKSIHDARSDVTGRLPRILIVEDVAVHRMIICKVAVKAGFAVSEAESCEEVKRLIKAWDFDCVTLDLALGEQEGTDVMKYFHEIGFRAPIIIVSVSDFAAAQGALNFGRALGLNMLEPVEKPVDLALLREILAAVKIDAGERRHLEALA
jgi:CheY-like chemotaxis protein